MIKDLDKLENAVESAKAEYVKELEKIYPRGRSIMFYISDKQYHPSIGDVLCVDRDGYIRARMASGHVKSIHRNRIIG